LDLTTNVTVVSIKIRDRYGNCARYVNENGEIDVGKAGAKILWSEGHVVTGLPFDIYCLTEAHCDTLYNNEYINKMINTSTFDLVIVDLIGNECGLALAKSLNVPIVGFWGFSFHGGEVMYTSSFNPPSIFPTFFSGLTSRMTFPERLLNFAIVLLHRALMTHQVNTAAYYIRQKFPLVPGMDKIVHDVDLILLNTNDFVDYPRLLPPNVIKVGGLQLRKPRPLPKVCISCF
jgi:hypothetical protein